MGIQSFQTLDGIGHRIPVGTIQNYLMRACLVVLIFTIALAVPSFDVVFAFFASFCGPLLQTIFPIYFGIRVERLTSDCHIRLSLAKVAILFFACLAIYWGLVDSVGSLLASLRPSPDCDHEFGHCSADGSTYHLESR